MSADEVYPIWSVCEEARWWLFLESLIMHNLYVSKTQGQKKKLLYVQNFQMEK